MSNQITIRVCCNTSCAKKGSAGIMQKIEQSTGLKAGNNNSEYDIDFCGCLGCCDFGPNLLVNNNLVLGVDKRNVMEKISEAAGITAPTAKEKEASLDKTLKEDILSDLI